MTDNKGLVTVTQEDRDNGAELFWNEHRRRGLLEDTYNAMRRGKHDDHPYIQAFARHRIAAPQAQAERIAELEGALDTAVSLLWEHCEGIAPRIEPLDATLKGTP